VSKQSSNSERKSANKALHRTATPLGSSFASVDTPI